MTHEDHDDYVWDRSGAPDPGIARLEVLLGPLRHREGTPLAAMPRRRRAWMPLLPVAAALACVVAGAAVWVLFGQQSGWWVQRLAGAPAVEGVTFGTNGRLRPGEWLATDAVGVARLAIGRIGRVVVEPNSRLQLVNSRGREHRIALERGTIHARIWAPPKFFFVNTPSAVAIDLGCVYTLTVDETGGGLLRVTEGWVALEDDRRTSFVPEGAMCATRQGAGPGTPLYDDAPSGYGPALDILDFGGLDHPSRGSALDLVLTEARQRDALTLWHLLARGTPDERGRVFDALSRLAPPPPGVTRDACLAGDRRALDRWWESLGIDASWWKVWKKKW